MQSKKSVVQSDVDEIPPDTVAHRLALLMRNKGVNQAIVVEHLGVSRGTVSKWLSNDAVPRIHYLHTLASFFGVTFNWLADGEEFSGVGLPDIKGQSALQQQQSVPAPLTDDDIQSLLDKHSQEPLFRLETIENPKTAEEIRIPFFLVRYPTNSYIQKMARKNIKPSMQVLLEKTLYVILVRPELLAHTKADLSKSMTYNLDSDNMQPRILNNALCFVDATKQQIRDGKVYLIRHGYLIKTCYLKRNADGSLVIINHNKAYPDEVVPVVDLHTVRVIGWVFMSHNTQP